MKRAVRNAALPGGPGTWSACFSKNAGWSLFSFCAKRSRRFGLGASMNFRRKALFIPGSANCLDIPVRNIFRSTPQVLTMNPASFARTLPA